MQPKLKAVLLALFACFIWGGSFVIARGVHEWIAPVTLAFYRWVVAFLAILVVSYKDIRSNYPILLKHWKYVFIMGAVGVSLFNTLVYTAGHYTSAHHIALISSTSPILTLVVAAIVGFDRMTFGKILGGITAFSGAIVVISHGDLEILKNLSWNKGDVLMLFSAFIWSIWCVYLQKKPAELPSKIFLLAQFFLGMVTLFPFYLWESFYVQPTEFSLRTLEIYLYLGIASSVIAWLAWQNCTKEIGAVKTSLIYYTLPIFTSIMAVIFLDESFKAYHGFGFMLIFMGIVISNIKLPNKKLQA